MIRNALKQNDKNRAGDFLQSLSSDVDEKQVRRIAGFTTNIMNFWNKILTLNIPGSRTEGQVSLALSRNLMG